MIFSLLLLITLLICLYGFSFILKLALVGNKENFAIGNIDIVYGIILLVFILILTNFFFPIKYSILPLFLIGVFSFIYLLNKKKN